ncbi:MAG: AsmA-like C-terminal region-containing protein [Winogradskyella arenosi]
MKKLLKIIGIIAVLFLAILIAIPFVLESKIDSIVQNYADENLNADLSFDDISLSLISSFPKASVNVDNLKITNRAPFEGETLATAQSLSFEMGMLQLLNGTDTPLEVNEIIANELLLVIKTNNTGAVNYDIVKESETPEATTTASESTASFSFDIEHYELNNSAFTYIDDTSNMAFYLTEINHSGTGIFSGNTSELDTETEAHVSFVMDSTAYLSNNTVKLDALIDLDLDQQKYTFKENKAFINALPLEFDGYIQLVEAGQQIDLSFKNPGATFKDFLALIPEAYAKDVADVSTTGNFTVNGIVKGLVSEETIPTLDINLLSENASFKFPQLPKSVKNIGIDVSIKNSTGNVDDTFVNIDKFNFQIDEDLFKAKASLKDVTKNMLVAAQLEGVLNLGHLSQAYPIELENELSGILKANMSTSFDMEAIETNAYQRIKSTGEIGLSDFVFSSEDILNPIQINDANLTFKPGTVSLNSFDAYTGDSDFSATGTINNLLGFMLSDKNLKGNFSLNSNTFALSDFMTEETTTQETSENSNTTTSANAEALKIPAFLDCTISANAKTVVYDNLNLKNVKGQLVIKDQTARLENMTTDIFNGQLGITGNVSTKGEKPTFDVKLGMENFDISQSFSDLEMLKALAPIAKVLQGKFNSTIDISGNLDDSFSPDLSTISGSALAKILTDEIDTSNSPLLSSLDSKLNFIDLEALNLKDIVANLSFENGNVAVKPFTLSYKDIPIEISGSHSFSNTMNYNAVLQVPAKYLGSDVNQLIGKIDDSEVSNLSIPVTANIGGTFSSPNVQTDLSSGVTNLTKQLIEIEKQKLIDQGKDKVKDLLSGLTNGNSEDTKTDSTATATETTEDQSTKDKVKEGVSNILGGLLGGSKKTTTAQDTTKTN